MNSSGFLVGSLSGVIASELVIPGCAICVGLLVAAGQGTRLNILSLGDEGAHALGLNVQRTRLMLLSLAALLAGARFPLPGLSDSSGWSFPISSASSSVMTTVAYCCFRLLPGPF